MEKGELGSGRAAMAYLSLPCQMTRATSRESFASDASLFSLSSAVVGETTPPHRRQAADDDDDVKTEDDSPELAGYREAILERMLETNNVSSSFFPKTLLAGYAGTPTAAAGRAASHQLTPVDPSNLETNKRLKEWLARTNLTSDDELILRAAKQPPLIRNARLKHKSLSTSDLLVTSRSSAQGDDETSESGRCRRQQWAGRSYGSRQQIDAERQSIGWQSEQSMRWSAGPPLPRLRLSKSIGRRIRDDLEKKLGTNQSTAAAAPKLDVERDKGRPVTKRERNFKIFHWLQSLDEDSFDRP